MNSMRIILAGLLIGSCAFAEEKQDWSPAEITLELRGTVKVPQETQEKLRMPERVAFEIKAKLEAKRIEPDERSRAIGQYSFLVKDADAAAVFLEVSSSFSLETADAPREALQRAHELLGRALSAALGVELKPFLPAGKLDTSLELKLESLEMKAK